MKLKSFLKKPINSFKLFAGLPTVFLFTLLTHASFAQEVVSASGGSFSNSSAQISYTLGEMVIETFAGANHVLTQGFHQTRLHIVGIEENPELYFQIQAYPNPVNHYLNIKTQGFETPESLIFMLFDMNGRLVAQDNLSGFDTQIDFQKLEPAMYFLRIFEGKKELTLFKVVKTK